MPYIKSISEFDREHGDYLDLDHGRRLYKDAATAAPMGPNSWDMREPPENENDRLRLKLEFARIVVDQAREDFEKLKAASLGQLGSSGMPLQFVWPVARYGPPPSDVDKYGLPDPVAALKRLRAIVQEREQLLQDLQDEFNALPETQAVLKRQEYQRREEIRRQNESLKSKNEIQKISL